MKAWFKHDFIDDVKTIPVKDYVDMVRKTFPDRPLDLKLFNQYKTIVVLSLSYSNKSVSYKGKGYGLMSRYTYGKDYHKVFNDVFKSLEATLKSKGVNAKFYADISPIDERFAAYLAGLGYIGKNQFLIHPTYGTWHFLAAGFIDQAYVTLNYEQDSCGDCRKCIDACPTGALDDGFNKRLCSSYVTQAKEVLTKHDVTPLKTMLFGCDICQRVCPKNEDISPVAREVFAPDEASQLHLKTLLSMSNKAIQRTYANYAFVFRGGLVLKRNAMALLYNQGEVASLPLMKVVYDNHKHVSWFEPTARMIIEEMETKK